MSDNTITIDDILIASRTPPLLPARVNYRFVETPPPSVCSDDSHCAAVSSSSAAQRELAPPLAQPARLQASLSDGVLIGLLGGPSYPEVATQASLKFILEPTNVALEDSRWSPASSPQQMVSEYAQPAPHTSLGPQAMTVATYAASQKLNAAVNSNGLSMTSLPSYQSTYRGHDPPALYNDTRSIPHKSPGPDDHMMGSTSPTFYAPKSLNVRPPPRISLPSIRTNSPGPEGGRHHPAEQSASTSPGLAKYSLNTIQHHSEQHLPRMQTSSDLRLSSVSASSRQTLPSLETTLSAISASSDPVLSARSPPAARTSSTLMSYFGPSQPTYSTASPVGAISPPRLPTAPSYWRTISRETTNSTPSDHASASASNGVSTPASSVPGLSPSHSYSAPAHTPAAVEHDQRNLDDPSLLQGMTPRPSDEGPFPGAFGTGSPFKCTFPGCTAAPFQTQYLLNSHANVHSETRPHFCPVESCPRGLGGQGFKRKNEMIRHGLVHQSPGYVCPFCPDQQHKYPRPDNLQRHVRVHHVDRDRDDPLLREVLAQRPEGGNRGRRRRLGS